MMGAGKTTVGKRLANKLGYLFVDLDQKIEEDEGLTIAEIFEQKGEQEFRNLEQNTLISVLNQSNVVVACGGGTPCFGENLELMNTHGYTVYLKYPVKTLCQRLEKGKANRPLLKTKTNEELESFIQNLLSEREPFYLKSSQIIDPLQVKGPIESAIISQLN